jgi:hypothetical protein
MRSAFCQWRLSSVMTFGGCVCDEKQPRGFGERVEDGAARTASDVRYGVASLVMRQ